MTFRRTIVVAALAAVALAAAAYWSSHREMVVERPSLGGPPPIGRPHDHQNLVGRRMPSFSGVDQNGQAIGTDALRGQVVVVNVWATWCRPCVEELPRFEREVWAPFRPRVTVIAVAGGESADDIKKFNDQAKLTFPLLEDPKGRIARRFGGDDLIPRTYVIDRSGVIVHQTLGYSDANFREILAAVEHAMAH